MEFNAKEIPASVRPIRFNADLCIGCGICVEVCQVDVMLPGKPPKVMWPGECYYCGSCVMECPVEGAISLHHPLMNMTRFVPVIKNDEKLKEED